MLPATEQLSIVAQAYAKATGKSLARTSTLIFNGGSRLTAIIEGGDLNTRSFEKAMGWFSENWPEAVDWPIGIQRPQPMEQVA